jgi:cytochrome c-type protein NapC
MQRDFCGSCHTMTPYTSDAANPFSDSLASLHSRNELFGDRSCYVCHADYGMYGTVSTKLSGMKHVWEYYSEFRDIPAQEALPLIHLYRPYPNANCMQCHSTRIAGWMEVDEHASAVEPIRSGAMSCASFGCHGPSHPFSKPEETP